jgi:hypothetical protein
VRSFLLRELEVMRAGRRARSIKVAVDGEIMQMAEPLRFRVSPQPLYLLKNSTPTGEAA